MSAMEQKVISERGVEDIIIPAFYDVHNRLHYSQQKMYWFPGGRGSTKSSFISLEILLCMVGRWQDKLINALVLRKNANTIATSTFAQILWAIDKLGMSGDVHVRRNPPEITINKTQQKIIFRGLDDPLKLKSLKTRVGYISLIWFEELTEMLEEEVRSVLQTTMRGGDIFRIFYSYNPSQFASHWVNKECEVRHPMKHVTKSSYLDVPREWLGEAFIEEAELLKERNERAYRNEYLGEVTGGGGQIFENLDIRQISDEEIKGCTDKYLFGIDWGFAVSPLCIVVCSWDKTRHDLRVIEEIFGRNIPNENCCGIMKGLLKKYHMEFGARIWADSAEPKSIDYMKRNGVPVEPCIKGADSIRYGVHFLQDLRNIIIDPVRCPNCASQFQMYEYQKNRQGEWIDDYPPKNDDAIDAVRYATTGIANERFSIFGT